MAPDVLAAPEGHNTHFAYDANGNVTSQTDPWGFVTTMQYDALDHAIVIGSTARAYTPSGQPTFSRNAEGQVTTRLYDALGREVESTDPRGRKTYRPWGRSQRFPIRATGRRGRLTRSERIGSARARALG